MKYIDADRLKKAVEHELDMQDLYLPVHFFEVVDGMETADVTEVVRCGECKWFGDIGCAIRIVDDSDRPSTNDFCSFAERKDNDDLISRQAAIDRINKQREHLRPDLYPQDKIGDGAYRICAEFIGRLPSAERHGRWESVQYGCVCSVCGKRKEQFSDNFCANCGAKMYEVTE